MSIDTQSPVMNNQPAPSSPNPSATISETREIEEKSAVIVTDAVPFTTVHSSSTKIKKSKKKEKSSKKGDSSSYGSVKKSKSKK
ncbi:hypothetical protein A2U01_0068913, partial [Trifolium medium]|nr:hypothetical protein [Trifolium medium]